MQESQRGKHERRPIIDTGGAISRGVQGSVVMRGPLRRSSLPGTLSRGSFPGGQSRSSPVRRGGRSGARLLVIAAVLFMAYWLAGTYRLEILERLPASYPILKALGYDVEQPVGFGLRAEVVQVDRYRDDTQAANLLINGVLTNSRSERVSLPRLRLVITSSRHAPITVIAEPPQPSLGPGASTRFEVRYKTGVTLFDVKVRVSFEKN